MIPFTFKILSKTYFYSYLHFPSKCLVKSQLLISLSFYKPNVAIVQIVIIFCIFVFFALKFA